VNRRRAAALAGAAVALAGCRLRFDDPGGQHAVLLPPDDAARAELVDVVTRELRAPAAVLLGDDALLRSSLLLVERAPHADPEGHPVDGRERGRPERFRLWLFRGRCELEHEGGGRATLVHARCTRAAD